MSDQHDKAARALNVEVNCSHLDIGACVACIAAALRAAEERGDAAGYERGREETFAAEHAVGHARGVAEERERCAMLVAKWVDARGLRAMELLAALRAPAPQPAPVPSDAAVLGAIKFGGITRGVCSSANHSGFHPCASDCIQWTVPQTKETP